MKHKQVRFFILLLAYSFLILFLSKGLDGIFQNSGTAPFLDAAYATRSFYANDLKEKPKTSLNDLSLEINKYQEDLNRVIYLTFDDGPSIYTKDIIHTLDTFDIKATFFLLEPNIKKYKEETLLLAENQVLGCHGVSHSEKFFYRNNISGVKEMNQCSNTLYEETGYQTKIIRTPYGSSPYFTQEIHDLFLNQGFVYWDWNIDSEDWKDQDNQRIIQTTLNQINNFPYRNKPMVILFHEQENTSHLLKELLPLLKEEGYTFKQINETTKPVQFTLQK